MTLRKKMAPMRTIIQKVLFYFLILIFFFEVLLIGSQYIQKSNTYPTSTDTSKPLPDQKMERVHLVEGEGGSKKWELFAESAEGFLGQGIWSLQRVRVVFYTQTGETFVVKGQRGQINTGSKDIDIAGDVTTHSSNGYDFQTQALHYRSDEKILVAPQPLRLNGPKDDSGQRLVLRGEGITTYLENSLINIENKVVAERALANNKRLQISSRKAQLSGRSNMVRFYESVSLQYEKMILKGPEALFSYEKNRDVPQSVIITGGVRLSDDLKKASAENIEVDLQDETYILRGSPEVVQGQDVIKGHEIKLSEGGQRVLIENIRARVDDTKKKSKEVK